MDMNVMNWINGGIMQAGRFGDWIYETLYRQAYCAAVIDFTFVLLTFLTLIGLNLLYFKNKKFTAYLERERNTHGCDTVVEWGAYVVISLLCIVVFTICLICGIEAAFNPDYWIIETAYNFYHGQGL